VAEIDKVIVGYLIAREAGGSGEILNLAVDPPQRRGGIARALLQSGLAALRRRGADEVFLEVRESNLAAQALYLSAGFRPVGQRAGYYRNPLEDALVLRLGFAAES
jgi:ribosomal-protein-alanine N-acetyltransferase